MVYQFGAIVEQGAKIKSCTNLRPSGHGTAHSYKADFVKIFLFIGGLFVVLHFRYRETLISARDMSKKFFKFTLGWDYLQSRTWLSYL